MRRSSRWLGLLALACGDGAVDADQLREDWLEHAPERYVARSCGTGFSRGRCQVTSVENQRPVESIAQDVSGTWARLDVARDPIEDVLSSLANTEGCDARVETDPNYHFPSNVYFDCGEEGYGTVISCFAADTLDLSLCQ